MQFGVFNPVSTSGQHFGPHINKTKPKQFYTKPKMQCGISSMLKSFSDMYVLF